MTADTESLSSSLVLNDQIVHIRAMMNKEQEADQNVAIVALVKNTDGEEKEIGFARYTVDDNDHCKAEVDVSESWRDQGLDHALMKTLIEYARHHVKELIYSIDETDNTQMLMLARELGMNCQRDPENARIMRYELLL